MTYTIQNVIWDKGTLNYLPQELYVRTNLIEDILSFDTYFNILSVEKLKSSCLIDNLSLNITASGHFKVQLIATDVLHECNEIILEVEFESLFEKSEMFSIDQWNKISKKFVFLRILGAKSSQICNIAFVTTSPVVRNVLLGATIVHYNRKNCVLPALSRLKTGLLNDPEYKDKISLIVIDNSCTIRPEEAPGVDIIYNKNLGGSGGFTRGLLAFKKLDFSHCLFMDDDASCEVESIKRTWALLAFAKNDNFTVAGSLFVEDDPAILYEKGAFFDYQNHALFGGYNLTKPQDLIEVERGPELSNFGGWWFFAFPIQKVSKFPFPFFVRGDDVMFSLQNDFLISTFLGIGCWGQEFASKSSPVTCYLDMRSLILNNISVNQNSILQTLKVVSKYFFLHLISFNYSSARAIRSSLYDTTLGINFWKENIDTVEIRKKIANYLIPEKMLPLNLIEYDYDTCPVPPHRSTKGKKPAIGLGVYLKSMILNGAIFPDFLMKKKYLLLPKGKYGGLKFAFRYNKIIFYDEKTSMGYVAKLNRRLLIQESLSFIIVCFKILWNGKRYRKELHEAVELYTKESFWRSVYQMH